MHTLRTEIVLFALCLAMAACGSSGQRPASADAVAAKDALQDAVDAADVPGDAKADDTSPDTPAEDADTEPADVPDTPADDAATDTELADVPDTVPDTPPADTTKPIPDALPWIDTNLTEPSDDCSGDAVYPPDGATLLLDVGPLLPANVVTGCGKGPPQPVSFGTECCDCPPPYSCYCNGECGWLRGPDLKVPQYGGKAVWTGKWGVSVRVLKQIVAGKWQNTLEGQRWDPSGGAGWESIPLPTTPIDDSADIAALGGKVYLKTHDMAMAPVRLVYDPASGGVVNWLGYSSNHNNEMTAVAGKMVEIGPASKNKYLQGALWLYDPGTATWAQAPFPSSQLPAAGHLTQGVLLGDANSAYLYDCAYSDTNSPFPDGTLATDVGHILKFDLATSTWSDIGLVPKGWRDGLQTANLRPDGAIVVMREAPGLGYQFGRFFGGNLQVGPFMTFGYEIKKFTAVDAPCGTLLAGLQVATGPTYFEYFFRVGLVRDDLSFSLVAPWGMPAGVQGTGLSYTHLVGVGAAVFEIGGADDGGEHRATFRYPLDKICK